MIAIIVKYFLDSQKLRFSKKSQAAGFGEWITIAISLAAGFAFALLVWKYAFKK